MGVIETVAVLFTDLVDSTGLLTRHGPEAMDAMRREHFVVLRRALGDRGREVKNVGDGLMVVFPSSSVAADVAVAMQQNVAHTTTPTGEALGLRVGIAVGDAEADELDYFGRPVVEAARLCAQAGGGEIYATDVVRALAGGRGGHEFVSIGELTLKGLDGSVAASRIMWSPTPAFRIALPGRLALAPGAGVHGRDSEHERISWLLKVASGDSGAIVVVSGEPGIGKTTLCGLVARDVHASGATVLYGRCDEGLAVPYRPWREALGGLVAGLPDLRLTPSAHRELSRLLPGLGEADAEAGDGDQHLLFAAVRELLATCSPVVLVLDDLHWADDPSMQLLRDFIVNRDAGSLAVLATFRDGEVTASSPLAELLAAAHRETGVERVTLGGLDDAALAGLMEAAAGHELGEDGLALRDALLAETDGNPFFVGELLRHLAETGAIVQQPDGRWTATSLLQSGGLPASVREVIGRRVARLGSEAEHCLTAAAVIGRDFELAVLALVVDQPEDDVLDLLEAAAGASLVVEIELGRFSFAHALVEHTLYEGLSVTRRSRLHGRVAAAMELVAGDLASDDRVAELAHHWSLASAPDARPKALRYSLAAGERALRLYASADALVWFERARELLDRMQPIDEAAMIDVLTGLGVAQRQSGDAAHRETLLDASGRALAMGDVDRSVRAVLANTRGHGSRAGGRDDERIEAAERTLLALGPALSPARARVLAVLAQELVWAEPQRAEQCADEAVAIAEPLGDERLLLDVVVCRARSTIGPDNARFRLVEAERAVKLARALDDPLSESLALAWLNMAAMQLTDLDRTLASFERGREIASRVREPTVLWFNEWARFATHIYEGDLVAAEGDIGRSAQVGRETGQPDADIVEWFQWLILQQMRGDLADTAETIASVDDLTGGLVRANVPEVLAAVGRLEEAWTYYAAHRDAGFPCSYPLGWLGSMCSWAITAAVLDDPIGATVLYDRLEPHGDELVFGGMPTGPLVAQRLGELSATLGRYDAAEEWFAKAEATARRMPVPYFVAQARLGRGAMRLRRDEAVDEARPDLEEALAIARRHGFGLIIRDAVALLSQ